MGQYDVHMLNEEWKAGGRRLEVLQRKIWDLKLHYELYDDFSNTKWLVWVYVGPEDQAKSNFNAMTAHMRGLGFQLKNRRDEL
ncbi:hypothetical protein ED733_000644 [Metarhizium rileyi]|nr:hypothetical protein ED733_000644 [Metarhizium rileyi]